MGLFYYFCRVDFKDKRVYQNNIYFKVINDSNKVFVFRVRAKVNYLKIENFKGENDLNVVNKLFNDIRIRVVLKIIVLLKSWVVIDQITGEIDFKLLQINQKIV